MESVCLADPCYVQMGQLIVTRAFGGITIRERKSGALVCSVTWDCLVCSGGNEMDIGHGQWESRTEKVMGR